MLKRKFLHKQIKRNTQKHFDRLERKNLLIWKKKNQKIEEINKPKRDHYLRVERYECKFYNLFLEGQILVQSCIAVILIIFLLRICDQSFSILLHDESEI